MKKWIVLLLFLSACSTIGPTPELQNYTDAGVLTWSQQLTSTWGDKTGAASLLSYGSAVSLMGLSTGALTAAAGGSPAVTGLALGTTVMAGLMQIFQPANHAVLYAQASEAVRMARGEYGVAATTGGLQQVPSTCLSPYGASLWAKIESILGKVTSVIAQTLPSDTGAKPASQGQRTTACK